MPPNGRHRILARWNAAYGWVAGQLAELRRIEQATNPRVRDTTIRNRFDRADEPDSAAP